MSGSAKSDSSLHEHHFVVVVVVTRKSAMVNTEKQNSRSWSTKTIVACTIVAAVAAVWYSVYTTNQSLLKQEILSNRRQAAVSALSESAGRFQMLSDGAYDSEKKSAIAARLI